MIEKKPKIFICDDDPPITLYLSKILKNFFETAHTNDSLSCVELVEQFEPDLILLDIHMPGKTGLEILTELKSGPRTSTIPVYILSAAGDRDSVTKAKNAGAENFILKPFQHVQIVNLLKERLGIGGEEQVIVKTEVKPLYSRRLNASGVVTYSLNYAATEKNLKLISREIAWDFMNALKSFRLNISNAEEMDKCSVAILSDIQACADLNEITFEVIVEVEGSKSFYSGTYTPILY